MKKCSLCMSQESPEEKPVPHAPQSKLASTDCYIIDGRRFDVERVFREDAHDTIATILLKLIRVESEQP